MKKESTPTPVPDYVYSIEEIQQIVEQTALAIAEMSVLLAPKAPQAIRLHRAKVQRLARKHAKARPFLAEILRGISRR